MAPEVSSLDFANGLTIQGFQIPSLRTRRAETEVELREGQYLAIAGLMDNETTRNLTKIPILGDIPILGELFKSRGIRDRRTELLVIVIARSWSRPPMTAPKVPTGEPGPSPPPGDWKREGSLKSPVELAARIRCSRVRPPHRSNRSSRRSEESSYAHRSSVVWATSVAV